MPFNDLHKSLSIVVTCDDHYIVLLAAMIKSIEVNLSYQKEIVLYIIENKISKINKQKLLQSIDQNRIHIVWKTMQEIMVNKKRLPIDRSSFPLSIYMRLFIPQFIPKEIDKTLYLDVDMIVEEDISKLFDVELEHYALAAVQDQRVLQFDNYWGGILNYTELGLKASSKYFNTGLLLLNLKKWRAENIANRVIDCIKENTKYAFYPDQYGLNVVLVNNWLALDAKWNVFSTDPINIQPAIIHFIQRKPIYRSYNFDEYCKKRFYFYLQQTAWKDFKPVSETNRLFKKIDNLREKLKHFLTPQ